MAPGPIAVLLGALPPDIRTMLSAIFRFPPLVSAGFMFIPLVVVAVLTIVIAVDFVFMVVIVAGWGDGRGVGHWAGQG